MTKPKPKSKHKKAGQPTKYRKEYCQQLIDFFNIPLTKKIILEETFNMNGEVVSSKEKTVANDLPFLTAFARKIGVSMDTLDEWQNVHPEFSEAYKTAKGLQAEFLSINALQERFAQPFSIFTAKNILGWRDKQEIEHSGEIKTYEHIKAQKEKYSK